MNNKQQEINKMIDQIKIDMINHTDNLIFQDPYWMVRSILENENTSNEKLENLFLYHNDINIIDAIFYHPNCSNKLKNKIKIINILD